MKSFIVLLIGVLLFSCDRDGSSVTPTPTNISINGTNYTDTKAISRQMGSWHRIEAVIADFTLTTTTASGGRCRVNDSNSWPSNFKEIHFDFANYDNNFIESGTYIVSNNGVGKECFPEVAEGSPGNYTDYFATSGTITLVVNTSAQTILIKGSFVANSVTYNLPTAGVIIPYDVCL